MRLGCTCGSLSDEWRRGSDVVLMKGRIVLDAAVARMVVVVFPKRERKRSTRE